MRGSKNVQPSYRRRRGNPLQGAIAEELQVDQKLVDIEIQGRTKCIVEPAEMFDQNWDEWVQKWKEAGGEELNKRANEYYKANR